MFQMLRKRRVNETHSTDTYFSSVKSAEGHNIAQFFKGVVQVPFMFME